MATLLTLAWAVLRSKSLSRAVSSDQAINVPWQWTCYVVERSIGDEVSHCPSQFSPVGPNCFQSLSSLEGTV